MTLTFRASQIETNKIISSGSTGTPTGAKLLIYPHDADDNTAPNQGYINQSVFNTGSIGTDIFLYVSGGVGQKNVGNSHAITCFGGDIHISGNLTVDGTSPGGGGGTNFFFSETNKLIEASGSLEISGSGYFLGGLTGSLQQVAPGVPYLLAGPNITVATNSLGQVSITGSAAGGNSLQDAYNAGLPLIGLNDSSGSINITGSLTPTDVYPSLLSLKPGFGGPYGSNYNAIDVYGWTTTEIQSASLVNIRGNGSNGGGGEVTLRSTGDFNGRIGWIAGSGQLYSSSPAASIQYHPNASALKISNESSTGKVSIVNTYTGGQGLLVVQNGSTWLGGDKNDSAVSFFPDPVSPFMGVNTYGTVYNSGSLEQSGSASFKNKVEISASLTQGYGINALGNYSHAQGHNTIASGSYSHAEGYYTTGSGDYSHAEGENTNATGYASHAEGDSTTASGAYSHAEGSGSTASSPGAHAEGYGATASGQYSHAEGGATTASGQYSHAEGYATTASGSYSHAEGSGTIASGSYSHAEGFNTTASGEYSHAEGGGTIASGSYSHAEGESTQSTGQYSHAEGYDTTASGDYSHAEGYDTTASGDYSHAEGFETTASGEAAHAEGYVTIASGQYSHAEGESTQSTGYSSHAEGDDATASGDYAHAEGSGTNASANYSHAEGHNTTASGSYSHAEGHNTIASGSYSHAEGFETTASGEFSHAEGESTQSTGYSSHAEGNGTTASGQYSHAEGNSTEAYGNYSHAEGIDTVASGSYSHAEGENTNATGYASHAEGIDTTASGYASHAEGYGPTASGDYSHAEGSNTTASGEYSHAEGHNTIAYGNYSHTEGHLTEASGTYSHAGGIGTIASGSGQTVIGSYNLEGNADSLFVIGDGKFVITQAYRGDIVRVNKGVNPGDGIVEVTGSLSVSGSGGSNGTLNQYNGLRYYPKIVTTLPYTASLNDYIIAVSASAGPGIQLPSSEFGRTFIVKDVSGSAATDLITITAAGGELIDGSPTATIGIDNGSYTFVYFGSGIGWGTI